MISANEIAEIKKSLEESQNPLFLFDNDADGLRSFLILQRSIGRGKGIPIKSFPELNSSYLRKIEELNPDAVFILDKPNVGKEFVEKVFERQIPIIWIDHHNVPVPEETLKKVKYYNSYPSAEPVTYIAYKISNKKEDMWLAMIGCISDVFLPDFAEEFAEKNPELFNSKIPVFDSLYLTEIGKIIRILNFGMMDTTTNVVKMIKYLMKAGSAYDLLEENYHTKAMHKRYNQLNKIYTKLLEKAESKSQKNEKLIFFSYSGETSMSSEIANALSFKNKNKIILVAFNRNDKVNISVRGKNALELTLNAMKDIENSSGGGHKEACGAQVPSDMLDKFKSNIEKQLS